MNITASKATTAKSETPGITIYPGHPYPLGATWDGKGVNFALYADNATGVELCLFDGRMKVESQQK